MGLYSDRAKGPKAVCFPRLKLSLVLLHLLLLIILLLQKEELSYFFNQTIRPQLVELTAKLEKIRHHDIDVIEV